MHRIIFWVGMALVAIPTIALGQPDTVWTASIQNVDRPSSIVPFLAQEDGFNICCTGYANDVTGYDFQLIRTNAFGVVEGRRFFTAIPDRRIAESVRGASRMPDGGFVMVGNGILRLNPEFEIRWF
ncbi:MAG: hypothetical protein FJY67_09380, partial [Calditrichaeota bacterium]|nr:hypothetical protein [Calditrichota bacterium]